MLKGKVALITGGSRGIGEAIACKMASLGAQVAILYAHNAGNALAVCEKCAQLYHVQAKAYRCDVSDFQAVKETVAQIRADFGTVHILVNNAGVTNRYTYR